MSNFSMYLPMCFKKCGIALIVVDELLKKIGRLGQDATLAEPAVADLRHQIVEVIKAPFYEVSSLLFRENVIVAFLLFSQVLPLRLLTSHGFPSGLFDTIVH